MKIKLETDFAELRLKNDSLLYERKPNRRTPRPIQIVSGRRQNDHFYLIRIKGISSRIGAMTFVGFDIFVIAEDRPILEENEYLIRDLVGL